MHVICLEESAFYQLVEQVVARLKDTHGQHDKWITDVETMKMLNIKSKTTLQKLRDEGEIRFFQAQRKNILYDRESVLDYMDRHSKNSF